MMHGTVLLFDETVLYYWRKSQEKRWEFEVPFILFVRFGAPDFDRRGFSMVRCGWWCGIIPAQW